MLSQKCDYFLNRVYKTQWTHWTSVGKWLISLFRLPLLMNELVLTEEAIRMRIYTIRGLQVMLDSDLAEFYNVNTKVLNQAVKRNIERFPEHFMFQLIESEYQILRSQIVTSSDNSLRSQSVTLDNDSLRFQTGTLNDQNLRFQIGTSKAGGRRYLPYVFTEQGVSMLSAVLRSETAVRVSIQIIDAFVSMRRFLHTNALLFQRLDYVEKKQITYDEKLEVIFKRLDNEKPYQGIFFEGQLFDAYMFVTNLIRKAQKSIVLIDNYIHEFTLDLFSKKSNDVEVVIYTKTISDKLQSELNVFNSQYSKLELKEFDKSHDRFMIIDGKDVYHIGASLKDLGKKWFAFSKFDYSALELLDRLKGEN